MAYDEQERTPRQLLEDFLRSSSDICWQLQFYLEAHQGEGEEGPLTDALVRFLPAVQTMRDRVKTVLGPSWCPVYSTGVHEQWVVWGFCPRCKGGQAKCIGCCTMIHECANPRGV